MKYGWTNVNLLDLWSEPKFNSERKSQLLYGTPFKLRKSSKGYLHIVQNDGYTGWLDQRFVKLIGYSEYHSMNKYNYVVITKQAKVVSNVRNNRENPYYLYYGTKLTVKKYNSDYFKIMVPSDILLLIKKNNIEKIKAVKSNKVDSKLLIKESKKFLGIPYLWGGVTVSGFDCSGLVQTVLSRFGIDIPRDTKDQIKIGEPVSRENIQTGDLIFFNRHVGFAIDKTTLIHSSVGGNGVRINSIKAGRKDYREDLDRDFNQVRRLACII